MSASRLEDLAEAQRFDLHLHTCRSDGALTEEALVRLAAARRLDVIALTDHDAGPTLPPGRHGFSESSVWFVHGAEVSALHEGREVHVLCYFPEAIPERFRDFLAGRMEARRERYESARAELGLPPRGDTTGRSWTRFHLAQDVVEAGIVANFGEAFKGPLRHGTGLVGPFGVPIAEVLALARTCGGITSWAHPDPVDAAHWAAPFHKMGLWGLECARPGLGKALRNRLQTLAFKAGLGTTGGSDWHGNSGDLGVFSFPRREAKGFVAALLSGVHRGDTARA